MWEDAEMVLYSKTDVQPCITFISCHIQLLQNSSNQVPYEVTLAYRFHLRVFMQGIFTAGISKVACTMYAFFFLTWLKLDQWLNHYDNGDPHFWKDTLLAS